MPRHTLTLDTGEQAAIWSPATHTPNSATHTPHPQEEHSDAHPQAKANKRTPTRPDPDGPRAGAARRYLRRYPA